MCDNNICMYLHKRNDNYTKYKGREFKFMLQEEIISVLEKLKSGEIKQYKVTKEDFLAFRIELVKREDFKHYRGIAQRGGEVIYEYLAEPRS